MPLFLVTNFIILIVVKYKLWVYFFLSLFNFPNNCDRNINLLFAKKCLSVKFRWRNLNNWILFLWFKNTYLKLKTYLVCLFYLKICLYLPLLVYNNYFKAIKCLKSNKQIKTEFYEQPMRKAFAYNIT